MDIADAVESAALAPTWDARVAAIRLIPEQFGTASHQELYSAIAKKVYVPSLAPDFAYVHWRDDYELDPLSDSYLHAYRLTNGFRHVNPADLAGVLKEEPRTLRVFRLIIGFTTSEFAAATALVDPREHAVSGNKIRSIESGTCPSDAIANRCAQVIDGTMRGELFGASPTEDVRLKVDKPDTQDRWVTVQNYAEHGVPLPVLLHQRLYGGAFRQLLDATSAKRGDILEDAVDELFEEVQIARVRTGSHNQEEIAKRFGITVKPAPDFVVYDRSGTLRAILECKGANDGGTARDKAARFRALRQEAVRLGGIPLFAVLAGLGWTRTSDALGPVIRDTEGRAFTIPTLRQMLTVQPFPALTGSQF